MSTLLLVPGLAGSTLGRQLRGTKIGYHIWMNYLHLNPVGLRQLALDDQGDLPLYPVPGTTIVSTGLLEAYYGQCVHFFESKIHTDVFHFDWRMDWQRISAALAVRMQYWLQFGPLYVVAHSFGGLAARAAHSQIAGTDKIANLKRVVCVGTPNFGSWEAVRNLAGIPTWIEPYARQMARAPHGIVYSAAVVWLTQLIAHFRSVYQCFPNHLNGPFAGSIPAFLAYQDATWRNVNPAVTHFLLDQGMQSVQNLPPIPEPEKYFFVAGYNLKTSHGLTDIKEIAHPDAYTTTPDGDSVVTVQSAIPPGFKAIYSHAGHAYLLVSLDVCRAIYAALEKGLAGDTFPD